MTRAVFAIPGDMHRRTGGFIYEAAILRTLNEIGCATAHLRLPDGFPDPTPADMTATIDLLAAVPADQPIILDGFIVGTLDPEALARIAAPVIAMVHHPLGLETGLPPDRAAWLMRNEAAVLARVNRVIVPSPETARILTARLAADPGRITIAPPGFDRPTAARNPVDPPLILSVGLIAPRKGHDVLIAALAQIADLSWQAEIVGGTHDVATAAALSDQIDELALGDRVGLVGEIDSPALAARFSAASIFALATRYEGYGMVLSEAMLAGLPVVSCRVGAVPETVGDAALLVPPDDPNAFAGALGRLLEDAAEAERLAALSRCKGLSLPDWHDTARIFAAEIAKLTPTPGSRA
jgi:glycosyltransferase involved in cell wall biosynthesis